MVTISETIFTAHFYKISFHKHVVTLRTLSLLNKVRRVKDEAVPCKAVQLNKIALAHCVFACKQVR